MNDPEKITIIEGPPPTFEAVNEPLLLGMSEGPGPVQIASCRLRTFNGPALVERCYRAWDKGQPIHLEFRSEEGPTRMARIVAARWAEVGEGHLLLLYVSLPDEEVQIELDFEIDDWEDDFDDDLEDSDFDLRM
jgi:hypothetical protein